MSASEKELSPEEQLPVNLPDDLRMQVIGFEEEVAKNVGNEIAAVVRDWCQTWLSCLTYFLWLSQGIRKRDPGKKPV